MLNKIINLDRRIIFVIVALAVIIPTILPARLPITVSEPTQKVYDYIEALPQGAAVMMSFDYGPSSMPEPTAIAKAVLRHCFSKGVRVIGMTLSIEGVPLAHSTIEDIAKEKSAVDGEDYTYLGFRPGVIPVILGMSIKIENIFDKDYAGKPLSEIPMMQQITNYNDIDMLLVLASGDTVESWITYAQTQSPLKIAAGTTAVINSQLYPFLQTGQLMGLLNGYLGAAEYETLMGDFAEGSLGLNIASWVHTLIVGLVIIGNIVFFKQQYQKQKD